MTQEERRKAIDNAVAVAAQFPMLPAAIRVGIAAMAEELRELRATCNLLLTLGEKEDGK